MPEPNLAGTKYECYGQEHLERLQLLVAFRDAGLSLAEANVIVSARQEIATDESAQGILARHLRKVEMQISRLQNAKRKLEALLLRRWPTIEMRFAAQKIAIHFGISSPALFYKYLLSCFSSARADLLAL